MGRVLRQSNRSLLLARFLVAGAVLASVAFDSLEAHASNRVYVLAEEQGQGVIRERRGECFLLTPAHVVGESSEVELIAEGRVSGKARFEATYPPDVALLRVLTDSRFDCPAAWDDGRRLAKRLADETEGIVASVNGDGSLQRRFVRIVSFDDRLITIRGHSAGDELFKGLSGSQLQIAGEPAGMLMQVDSETGEGLVFRQDYLTDLVQRFFAIDEVRPATRPPRAAGEATMQAEAAGLVFGLKSCAHSAGKLECGFTITNQEGDRELTFWGGKNRSRIFDESGNEVLSTAGKVADTRAGLTGGNHHLKKTLISQVPVAASLTFDALPADSQMIMALKLIAFLGGEKLELEFRNVPLDGAGPRMGDVPVPAHPELQATAEASGFLFGLESCGRSAGKLECSFTITNQEGDRELTFWGGKNRSRIFDESGNEVLSTAAKVADTRAGLTGGNHHLKKLLISQVPVAASLTFDALPAGSRMITALKLIAFLGRQKLELEYRNVPIAGSGLQVGDAPPLPTQPDLEATAEASGFVFGLESCGPASGKLECSFTITNQEGDRELTFWGGKNRSRLFDESGNEVLSTAGKVADTRAGLTGGNHHLKKLLISQVPVAASLTFDALPRDSRTITALKLIAFLGRKKLEVEFRNIPIGAPAT